MIRNFCKTQGQVDNWIVDITHLNLQRIIIQKTYRCLREMKFSVSMFVNEFHDKSLQKKYTGITSRAL